MRLTITILRGTRAGQRFVVSRGETLRFGRTARADVVVADDLTMSALHFELEWAEAAVVVRDLQSRNGLFLNGEAVTEAVLVDGDQLRAGRTCFSVSIVDPLARSVTPNVGDETRAPGPCDATRAVPRAPDSTAAPHAEPLPATTLFPGRLTQTPDQLDGDTDEGLDASDGSAVERSAAADRVDDLP